MTLIAIGGAEEKEGDMIVLKRVLQEAKGVSSRVHVITTATSLPAETKKAYEDAFRRLGVECTVTHISTREEANDPKLVKRIADADVVFFSGGDQLQLTSILGGTAFINKIISLYKHGAVVAGTSAGAAAASSLMIYGGGPQYMPPAPAEQLRIWDTPTPVEKASLRETSEKDSVLLTTGFSLLPNVVFDTHFSPRNRLARLFNAIATNPVNTGIGLDENTAVVMRGKDILEVVGTGTVTIVNTGSAPLKLLPGQRYSLKKKKLVPSESNPKRASPQERPSV